MEALALCLSLGVAFVYSNVDKFINSSKPGFTEHIQEMKPRDFVVLAALIFSLPIVFSGCSFNASNPQFVKSFRKSFRENFIKSCAKSNPMRAQVCACAADRFLERYSIEQLIKFKDIPQNEQDEIVSACK